MLVSIFRAPDICNHFFKLRQTAGLIFLCVMFQELALLRSQGIMAKASWGLDLCPAGSLEFIWTKTALGKKGLEERFSALLGSSVFMTSDLFQINASFQQRKSIFRLPEMWLTSASEPQSGWKESKTKSKIIRHKKGSGSLNATN